MHRDRTIHLHGQRFHYTEWGDPAAPPVLLLHGVTGHARTWDDTALTLRGRFRVLALDQRGHGDSDPAPDGDYTTASLAADLAAFVEAMALPPIRLVGLSMGGRVAIAYTAAHPQRVARLVVVDIGPELSSEGRQRVGLAMAQSPERFDTVEAAFVYARSINPRYAEPLLRHRVEQGLRALPNGGVIWKYDRALRDAVRAGRWRDPIDLWPPWEALRCPTLLVRGADSDLLSVSVATRMIERQPRARLVEIPGAGHSVPGDQPTAFAAALQAFLDP